MGDSSHRDSGRHGHVHAVQRGVMGRRVVRSALGPLWTGGAPRPLRKARRYFRPKTSASSAGGVTSSWS